jgi:hypothetical protein
MIGVIEIMNIIEYVGIIVSIETFEIVANSSHY